MSKIVNFVDYCSTMNDKIKNAIIQAYENGGGLILLEGSRGCLDGDSLLETANGKIKIKDFKGGLIKSWDGEKFIYAYAGAAVEYEPKELYEVRLENGACFLATENHYSLSRDGFLPVADVRSKELAIYSDQIPTNLDTYPEGSLPNAHHLIGIILNYLYGYWRDCHHGGEPLLSGVDTYLDIVPSLTDAQISNRDALLRMDDLSGLLRKCVRLYQRGDRLSTSVVRLESAELDSATVDTYIYEKLSELLNGFFQAYPQSLLTYNLPDITGQFLARIQDMLTWISRDENLSSILGLKSFAFDDNSFSDSFAYTDNTRTSRVKSIKKIGKRKYYDIFVPYFHTYIANGVLHHNSGKSWGAVQAVHQLLLWGYTDTAIEGLIVEKKLSDSITTLNEEIGASNMLPDSTMYEHHLATGQTIIYQGFHPSRKTALKGGEKGGKLIFIDEVENWGEKAAMDTLNTYLRKDGIIILASNHFPQYILDFAEAYRKVSLSIYIRIDYWENPYLAPTTKAIWDSLKEENETLWRATVLYDDEDEYVRLFSPIELESMTADYDSDFKPLNTSIGVDVAIGGGDCSVISKAILGNDNHVYVHVGEGLHLDNNSFVGRVMQELNEFKPNWEVWDADGQGLAVLQTRGKHPNLIEFHGASEYMGIYFNRRAAAYGNLEELSRQGRLHLLGSPQSVSRCKEDLRSQFIINQDNKSGKIQLAKKDQIKRVLGRSPDYSDSVAMAVYGLKFGLKNLNSFGMLQNVRKVSIKKKEKPQWLKV